jgi:hypothetical protein
LVRRMVAASAVAYASRSKAEPTADRYFGSGPGGPPGVPGGGMTGVELGCGTGAGFTISGSTPGAGLITPPLASNLSLRLFLWVSPTLSPCVPRGRDASGNDKSFSGIVWLPAGSPGAVCADAPPAPKPNNPVKTSGNTAFISHLRCKLGGINAEDSCFVPLLNIGPPPDPNVSPGPLKLHSIRSVALEAHSRIARATDNGAAT